MKRLTAYVIVFILSVFSPHRLNADDPPGQIAVSPSMFELKIGSQPVTESLRLRNLKKKAITLKAEVYNWTIDEQNQLKMVPPNPQSIDQWMVINPVVFTIEPGKEQVVRFSIRPRSIPDAGEHRAIIYFSEQPTAGNVGGVEILFKLGVGIYGYTDPVKHAAVLNSLTLDRATGTLRTDILNSGNVHTRLKGDYTIWQKGTFPGFKATRAYLNLPPDQQRPEGLIAYGSMNNTPVLPGSRRTISTVIQLPDTRTSGYIVAVEGTIDDKKVEKLFQ